MVKRIAITQRVVECESYVERRDALARDWVIFFSQLYPEAVLMPLPNHPAQVVHWLESVQPDVIVFSNGNDWGEAADRDETERRLYAWGTTKGLPLLGICRGMQVFNALNGGAVEPDVTQYSDEQHVAAEHPVIVTDPSFANLLDADNLQVNSFHKQCVVDAGLSLELAVFARSPGGIVEGIYHKQYPMLGLQWHPERKAVPAESDVVLIRKLFEAGTFWHHQVNHRK